MTTIWTKTARKTLTNFYAEKEILQGKEAAKIRLEEVITIGNTLDASSIESAHKIISGPHIGKAVIPCPGGYLISRMYENEVVIDAFIDDYSLPDIHLPDAK